ncbi:hypothetical protein [Emcibacter sp.]|uniref:hypothetical protein n=1 Tax=Emcibacter sp. TaxID=1979954 RepID=UPI003A8E4897
MKKNLKYFTLVFALCLSACGGKFSGEYRALQGAVVMDFKPDGKVSQSMIGNRVADFDFEKDGDEIKVYIAPGLTQIYKIQSDDVLIGPGGITLVRKR